MSKGRRVSRKPEFVKLQMRQCIQNKIYLILCKRPYGGILLPPTCKINYVNMQHNYVNMRRIYVDMQHNYVDMHVINFCQKLFFSMGKFSY